MWAEDGECGEGFLVLEDLEQGGGDAGKALVGVA